MHRASLLCFSLVLVALSCRSAEQQAVVADGIITLPIDRGTPVVLRDSSTEHELVIDYSLREVPKLSGFYLVDFICYECQGWLAVSRRTGRISPLDGRPVASPANTWLAATHWDDGGFNETRVTVYRLDSDTLARAWSINPEAWVPDSLSWQDDSTATVFRTYQPYDSLHGRPMPLLYLRFRSAQWQLDSGARAP